MKNRSVLALTALLISCTITMPLLAGPTEARLYNNTSKYSYSNGGEFTAVTDWNPVSAYSPLALYSVNGNTGFQTFCIEYHENFSVGQLYDVQLNDRAIYGGEYPDGDPISKGTAWLYQQFATGNLSQYNYGYGSGRIQDAGQLQAAFWYLEEESAPSNWGQSAWWDATTNKFLVMAGNEFGNIANAMADYDGTAVAVMNLSSNGCPAQDQLVLIPVPAPDAVLLAGLGTGIVGWLRRRRVV